MKSVAYFLRAGLDGPIKIGFTSNLRHRLTSIETSSSEEIFILSVIDGARELEQELHRRFWPHRVRGEWFAPVPELLAYIATLPPYTATRVRVRRTLPPSPPEARRPKHPASSPLRRWREEKGWTRKQAAEYLEINARTLESWESGARHPPGLSLVEKLVFGEESESGASSTG